MFVRPTGIVPGYTNITGTNEIWRGRRMAPGIYRYNMRLYGHHWDDLRRSSYKEDGYESGSPRCLKILPSTNQTFNVAKTTKPTIEARRLIDAGATEFPSTIDAETEVETKTFIRKYQDSLVEVIRQKQVAITGFQGIAVDRTCNQLNEEISDAIYRGNTFVFDERARSATPGSWDERQLKQINGLRYKIPGLPDRNGNQPSEKQAY